MTTHTHTTYVSKLNIEQLIARHNSMLVEGERLSVKPAMGERSLNYERRVMTAVLLELLNEARQDNPNAFVPVRATRCEVSEMNIFATDAS